MIKDIENPTEGELLSVQEYFLESANQLVVIPTDIDNIDTTINTESIQGIEDVNTLSIQDIDGGLEETAIAPQTAPQTENTPAPLATTTKNELVASTAVNLGIELSTTEIDQIADNFDAGSDDFSQTLEQVKGAIIAYVQHKIASNNQQIVNTINEISQVASDGFEENSQTLSEGLKHLNQQLVQQSNDFKSKLTGTLSRFQLPAAS
jgi:uncharacterized protein YukE